MSERHLLRAGDVEVELDGADLRYLRVGETELIRRVYAAVRDHNWVTLPGTFVEPVRLAEDDRGVHASFALRHVGEEIDLTWRGTVDALHDGSVRLGFRGRAAQPFRYNRIGYCVLHPLAGFAGQRFRGESPTGAVEGVLPELVATQPFVDGAYVPFVPSVSALSLDVAGGGTVELRFQGDLWESEDQRNWSDASIKTYCTPLSLGIPHRLAAGAEIVQAIEIRALGVPVRRRPKDAAPDVVVGLASGAVLPPIGTCAPPPGDEPSDVQVGELRALALSHLRVDVRADDPAELARGSAIAAALGCPVELALHLRAADDLGPLTAQLTGAAPARVIVLDADARSATASETASDALVARARASFPRIPVLAGTDMNFAELNRTRPDLTHADGVAYPVAAEVHAFDDRSVLETPEAQADQVATARGIAEGGLVAVSPISLRPRFNAVAIEESAVDESALPDSVDSRQREGLAAAFALASIARCASAGADAITLFRLSGWEGLVERAAGSRLPARFPSMPGERFPVVEVFGALAGLAGTPLRTCELADPLATAAIALDLGDATRVVVANLRDEPRRVRVLVDGDERSAVLAPYDVAVLDQ